MFGRQGKKKKTNRGKEKKGRGNKVGWVDRVHQKLKKKSERDTVRWRERSE